MNNLIIFDLDGVLIDSRDLHYKSLNAALEKVWPEAVIEHDEHLAIYDGISTKRKLDMLSVRKGLPAGVHAQVWSVKQAATIDLIKEFPRDERLVRLFAEIKDRGFKIAVCSNSIRETVKHALLAIGVMPYVDVFVSNEDVTHPKPHPEMYWRAMTLMGTIPARTVIVEDSEIGREGAKATGAHQHFIRDADDLDPARVLSALDEVLYPVNRPTPLKDKRLNVVIPMAGAGSRFASQGYKLPKPLIDVNGQPMIKVVTENLGVDANFIYICQREHYERYNLEVVLRLISPGCRIVLTDGMTEGAACTVLLAREHIDNDMPLLMANSDQFVEWEPSTALRSFQHGAVDAGIITFPADHPKWSYARLGADGYVAEVAEKRVISEHATVGIYYWSKGSDFVANADRMIQKNIRVNNEFYVCPVFNEAIEAGAKVKIHEATRMWGIGTPEDLEYFLENYRPF